MPDLTSAHDEWWPFNTSLCFLHLKKNFIKVISSPNIRFCCNLKSKPLCQTLSNALDISRQTPLISWLLSKAEGISCAIDSNWLVQKSPGLNSGCFGNIKPVSEKNENVLLQSNCSNTLPQTSRRETGR